MIVSEVILPLRVATQPQPQLYARGDCGACVLSGLMGMSVEEVYTNYSTSGVPAPFTWISMREALRSARLAGHLERLIDAAPTWHLPEYAYTFGMMGWQLHSPWFRYIRMGMEAGYYGLAVVNLEKLGPILDIDHYVLLCGARTVYEAGCFSNEVLVSCSATNTPDEEWVDVKEFLRYRGGFNTLLAKPVESS